MRHAAAALLALAALAAPAVARAEPALVPVAADFASLTHIAGPPADPDRLFVVEHPGTVQLVVDGVRASTPFADLTDATAYGGEGGLLSIAFPHDYASSGLFYVFLTAKAGVFPGVGLHDLVVLEGRRSLADPDVADPGYRRVVFSVPHPDSSAHNGGQLAFGPDGALYVSTGDGGGQGDPEGDAQSLGSLLGKILRIELRNPSPRPLIHAVGLRNPWRFSFDRVTGDMVIGDVGGSAQEEIDFAPAGTPAGRNYGWNLCEGTFATHSCDGYTAPAIALPHTDGYRAVIGGFVVRDTAVPSLVGRYLFGDLWLSTLRSAALPGNAVAGGGDALRRVPDLVRRGRLRARVRRPQRRHLAVGGG